MCHAAAPRLCLAVAAKPGGSASAQGCAGALQPRSEREELEDVVAKHTSCCLQLLLTAQDLKNESVCKPKLLLAGLI